MKVNIYIVKYEFPLRTVFTEEFIVSALTIQIILCLISDYFPFVQIIDDEKVKQE